MCVDARRFGAFGVAGDSVTRQGDDGSAFKTGFSADFFREVVSVHIRQIQIEQDQVGDFFHGCSERGSPVGDVLHIVPIKIAQ